MNLLILNVYSNVLGTAAVEKKTTQSIHVLQITAGTLTNRKSIYKCVKYN